MEVPLIAPTEEEMQAAREVVRLNSGLVDQDLIPYLELVLVKYRRRWGSDKFDVRCGLREPHTLAEQCDLDLFEGRITVEEAREQLLKFAQRPVDAEMLRGFFAQLESSLQHYSRFTQEVGKLLESPRRSAIKEADEVEIDRWADVINGPSKMYKQEIHTVLDFLQEGRVEKQKGIAKISIFTAATAAELVVAVTEYAVSSWRRSRQASLQSQMQPEYRGAGSSLESFGSIAFKSLPLAQELLTLLEEEHALARVCLRERLANPASPAIQTVDPPKSKTPVLLTVARWSDLAIGIDENWRYWALTPAPQHGTQFQQSRAIELALVGERWKALLMAFAASETGNRVKRADLLQSLGYFSPGPASEQDRRARPGAIEEAQIEGMLIRMNVANKRLTTTLGDLRRELGKLVQGPSGRSSICLQVNGDRVESGFVVRPLLRDEAGKLNFGTPPSSH